MYQLTTQDRQRFVDSERLVAWMLVAMLVLPSVNYFLNSVLQFGFSVSSISMFIYGIMALIGLYSYKFIFSTKGINAKVFLLTLALVVGMWVSYARYPTIALVFLSSSFNPLESGLLMVVLYCVPMMILASVCRRWDLVLRVMLYCAYFIAIIAYFAYKYTILLMVEEFSYMSFSYHLLPVSCICMGYAVIHPSRTSIIHILVSLLATISILIVGARGAFVCALLFYVLIYWFYWRKNKKTRIVSLAIATILIGAFVLNFSTIVDSVDGVMSEYDTSSRTLTKMSTDEFAQSDGRDAITSIIKDAVDDKIFGWGLFGDRYILSQNGYGVTISAYCHSIIWEFLCSFGIILGTVLLLLLVVGLVRMAYIQKSPYARLCFFIFVPIGFLKLFVTGSFVMEMYFWTLIGMMCNTYINKKQYVYSHSHRNLP